MRRGAALVLKSLVAGIAMPPCAGDAHADYRVCNKTHILANVALGVDSGEQFSTEGWWTLSPGECATVIANPLKYRYLYLYAMNIAGVAIVGGPVRMCIDDVKFKAIGAADCWRRGLKSVGFWEIDTRDASDWTTFLTDEGK